jgi:hypothetical protein
VQHSLPSGGIQLEHRVGYGAVEIARRIADQSLDRFVPIRSASETEPHSLPSGLIHLEYRSAIEGSAVGDGSEEPPCDWPMPLIIILLLI